MLGWQGNVLHTRFSRETVNSASKSPPSCRIPHHCYAFLIPDERSRRIRGSRDLNPEPSVNGGRELSHEGDPSTDNYWSCCISCGYTHSMSNATNSNSHRATASVSMQRLPVPCMSYVCNSCRVRLIHTKECTGIIVKS